MAAAAARRSVMVVLACPGARAAPVAPLIPMTAALWMVSYEFTINWVTRVLYTIVALALFLCKNRCQECNKVNKSGNYF